MDEMEKKTARTSFKFDRVLLKNLYCIAQMQAKVIRHDAHQMSIKVIHQGV